MSDKIIVIESHDENGCEWGISFNGSNPELKDYVKMIDEGAAFKLQSLIEGKCDCTCGDAHVQISTLQAQVDRYREALEKIEVYNWGWNEDLIDDICNMKDIALEALKEKS